LPTSRAQRNSLTLIDAAFHPDRRATGQILIGPTPTFADVYQGVSGPSFFGFGYASTVGGAGDIFNIDGSRGYLDVPTGFVSGGSISSSTTFAHGTFTGSLNPGTYVYTWGQGELADSVTVQIDAVPEPSTWAMMILGFCGLGFIARYRRNKLSSVACLSSQQL
ncbi:PEPxxWA-CTERM sorting domain-containing protein, partial [Bradyrhizobium sp. WYCCWR 13023]